PVAEFGVVEVVILVDAGQCEQVHPDVMLCGQARPLARRPCVLETLAELRLRQHTGYDGGEQHSRLVVATDPGRQIRPRHTRPVRAAESIHEAASLQHPRGMVFEQLSPRKTEFSPITHGSLHAAPPSRTSQTLAPAVFLYSAGTNIGHSSAAPSPLRSRGLNAMRSRDRAPQPIPN